MSEHKMKELREKAEKELREKIRQRLFADDVTFEDFSKIDNYDFRITPSINDVTYKIWSDIISYMEEYCMTFYNRNNKQADLIIAQTLDEIGDIVLSKLSTMPIPYDDRYYSEIMEDEHVTLETAKIYRYIINIGIDCVTASEMKPWTEITNKKFKTLLAEDHALSYYLTAKRLIEKQIGKIKMKDLING